MPIAGFALTQTKRAPGATATGGHQGEGEGAAGPLPEAAGPRQVGQGQDQGEGGATRQYNALPVVS